MKKCFSILCMMIVVGAASTCFALDPILIGDFETGLDGFWNVDFDDLTRVTSPGVTRGNWALKAEAAVAHWGMNFEIDTPSRAGWTEALLAPDSIMAVDATAFAEDIAADYCNIGMTRNMAADNGWDREMNTAMILDGQPHTYYFTVSDATKAAIQENLDNSGWGANIGIGIDSTDSVILYFDNIWIFPEGVIDPYGPYNPSIDQDFNVDPEYVDLTLYWKAGQDPGGNDPDPNIVYPVNPNIVDEYVFMTDGTGDPNLFYLGATGVDPGLYDPNSEYGPIVPPLMINTSYTWAVVEALDGYEQTLTVGVSTLDNVDPNNITGPIWNFNTLSTLPEITAQPESTRFAVDETSAVFTISASSPSAVSYQWFYSPLDAEINDPGDTPISASIGGDTDTLTIPSANKAYQAYFYCRVSNAATVSGGGLEPDLYSDVVSLVIERKIGEYLFDGDVIDSSDSGYDGTVVGSPTYVAGVDAGSAISLDGATQYVELGAGDPNLAYPKADLVEDDGIGGGLDVGTISCWVKLNATVADQVSPIMYNANAGWPTTVFQFEVPTDSAAANTNLRTVIWGDDEVLTMIDANPVWADPFSIAGDGQWHMLASAWDRTAGTIKAYLDGNLLATWESAPSVFSAWDSSTMIGSNGTDYFDGLIDNLRVYNYEVAAEDIAQEYYDTMGSPGCIDLYFVGSQFNVTNVGSSYCKIDLADFAVFAENWLNDGFYPDI